MTKPSRLSWDKARSRLAASSVPAAVVSAEAGAAEFAWAFFSSMAFNRWISTSYYLSRASFGSSLTLGLFLIALALEAYLKVDRVSS